jgi:hypothetical protein
MRLLRPHAPRALTALAGVLATGLLLGAPAAAEPTPCRTSAARHLERIGIDPGDVADIAMVRIISLPEVGGLIEVQAWASLKSCRGSVVVKLTPLCRVKETYARGRCEFPNIRHF